MTAQQEFEPHDSRHHHCRHHHHRHPQHQQRLRQFWGLLLLVAGSLLLLHQFDLLPFLSWPQWAGNIADYGIAHLFAALLAISGLSHLFSERNRRGLWKAVVRLSIAAWLFACLQGLAGLTFANSWPLLLILFGFGILLRGTGCRVRFNTGND